MAKTEEAKIKEVINKLDNRQVTTPRRFLKEYLEEMEGHTNDVYRHRDSDIIQHQHDLMTRYIAEDDEVAWVDEANSQKEQGWAIAWGDESLILFHEGAIVARCIWSCRGTMYSVHIEEEDV